MTDHTDELAGLPEDVREAWRSIDYATPDVRGTCIAPTAALETVFHDHMRLAHDCAEHAAWRDINERARFDQQQRAERAEAELAAIKATPTGTVLDWALRRAEKAEAELAALKRSQQGTVQAVRTQADGCYLVEVRCDSAGVASLFSQRVALLPVGGECER